MPLGKIEEKWKFFIKCGSKLALEIIVEQALEIVTTNLTSSHGDEYYH